MRVILQITAGPYRGRQIPIQSGERARFGRSEGADVCFPEDLEMSDVHLELECKADHCLIRDLNRSTATWLNDQPVEEAVIGHGDRILAGQTEMQTSLQGAPRDDGAVDEHSEVEAVEEKLSTTELCQRANLEDRSLQLLRPDYTPEAFIRVLTEHKQFADAISVLSHYLPKRDTVFWACRSVEEASPRDLVPEERAALDSALAFLKDPSEKNRRSAMAIAEQADYATAASCVAAAASWSEGSMGPPEYDEVPTPPQLTGQVATAALMMTANEGDVATTEDRYQQIIQIGQQVLSGESNLDR